MVEPRVIARMIRMLSRHVKYDTQLVVLVSRETGAATFLAVDDPRFRQNLEHDLGQGLSALGLVAFDQSGERVGEGHFSFPWLQNDSDALEMFERICRQRGVTAASDHPMVPPPNHTC